MIEMTSYFNLSWWPRLSENLAAVWNFTIITVDQNAITVGTLSVGILLFVLGFYLSRRLSLRLRQKVLSRWITEPSALHSIQSLSFYVFFVFFSLMALNIANIPLTIFTVIGGALAIGIGFGSQNIVNNFISGLILMMERPVKVGDYIELDNIYGQIQDIGMRSTRILTRGNRHMLVPNSSFLEKNVINWTYSDQLVRGHVSVGVSYGSPVREVEQLLKLSVEKLSSRIKSDETIVNFSDFGDNALTFDVFFWIELQGIASKNKYESELRFLIYEILEEAGVVIAFPQRDTHLFTQKPIEIAIKRSTSKQP